MCRHRNVTILEIGREELTWNIKEGKAINSGRNAGSMDDYIGIQCYDCGLNRGYSRHSRNLPQWVRRYIRYINSGSASDDERDAEQASGTAGT